MSKCEDRLVIIKHNILRIIEKNVHCLICKSDMFHRKNNTIYVKCIIIDKYIYI